MRENYEHVLEDMKKRRAEWAEALNIIDRGIASLENLMKTQPQWFDRPSTCIINVKPDVYQMLTGVTPSLSNLNATKGGNFETH